MVEIALCIAIVAIAMVAIMGVMPTGLNVQKQNREDTIIDQEAQILLDAIRIFDDDRFIPHKPRIVLVDGDIESSVPQFVARNPGLRISLLHIDCDLYKPTKAALDVLWPRVVRGGVVVFDDYGIRPWEGESAAADEYFAAAGVRLRRFEWSHIPGAYLVKE